ncbi:MAG: hypothetical protein ACK4H7_00555 [Acidilobaceae archaeon]
MERGGLKSIVLCCHSLVSVRPGGLEDLVTVIVLTVALLYDTRV